MKGVPIWVVGLMLLSVACEFIPIDAVKNGLSPSLVFAAVASMGWLVTDRTRAAHCADRADRTLAAAGL